MKESRSIASAGFLVLVLIAAGVIYLISRQENAGKIGSEGKPEEETALQEDSVNALPNQNVHVTTLADDSSTNEGVSLGSLSGEERLLAKFELIGDIAYLEEAQRLYPDSIEVIYASALLDESAESEWLKKIEELEPDNSFPNLARAFIYAKNEQFDLFVEELHKALSKKFFDTGLRERQSIMLDAMLEGEQYPRSIIGVADRGFWDRLTNGIDILVRSDDVRFGSLEERASMVVGLAEKLRSQGEFSFSHDFTAHLIEAEMLHKFQSNDLYGSGGQTVGDRLEELRIVEANKGYFEKMKKYSEFLSSPSTDPDLKARFFVRMRADGERAAVNWLMRQ